MDTIDTYEIKYGDWDEPRAVKVKRKGESRKEIKQKEIKYTPEEIISAHIKGKISKEASTELKDYFDWVKKSLEEGEAVFENDQLNTENGNGKNRKYTKVTNIPTKIFGQEIGTDDEKQRLIQATAKAYLRVDEHFKLWTKTSEAFKKVYLNE